MPAPTTRYSPTPGGSATRKPRPPTTSACAATSSTTSKELTSTPSAMRCNASAPQPTAARLSRADRPTLAGVTLGTPSLSERREGVVCNAFGVVGVELQPVVDSDYPFGLLAWRQFG